MKNLKKIISLGIFGAASITSTTASAGTDWCTIIDRATFIDAVKTAYVETNGIGFGLPMWATLMNQAGVVCQVYSVKGGNAPGYNGGFDSSKNAWLGSRVISAQKANTANAFSLNALAISTGALSAAVYPGGSLYGLQHSNPVDTAAYGSSGGTDYGTSADPMVGTQPGGVNVFGGGVALYANNGNKIGSVGVSGDSSCRDHAMAYRLRIALGLDNQPNDDGLRYVETPAALFEQPLCGNGEEAAAYASGDSSANDLGIRP